MSKKRIDWRNYFEGPFRAARDAEGSLICDQVGAVIDLVVSQSRPANQEMTENQEKRMTSQIRKIVITALNAAWREGE